MQTCFDICKYNEAFCMIGMGPNSIQMFKPDNNIFLLLIGPEPFLTLNMDIALDPLNWQGTLGLVACNMGYRAQRINDRRLFLKMDFFFFFLFFFNHTHLQMIFHVSL